MLIAIISLSLKTIEMFLIQTFVAIKEFHILGCWLKGNKTNLTTLIPETKNPLKLRRYKSISLVKLLNEILYSTCWKG